jgi:pimeloyl-ACP methyl ester carboxylesterase
VIPAHFGRKDRLLFGIYTPARGKRRRRGALLCGPWGAEALRAHRSLKTLSDLLADDGFDVFRFDYFGAGDSMGESLDVTLAGQADDTESAIEELLGAASIPSVSLVGLRLGACAATAAAARRTRHVDRIVMWEPIPSGVGHLAELLPAGVDPSQAESLEVGGYALSPTLIGELGAVWETGVPQPHCPALVIRSSAGDRPEWSGGRDGNVSAEVVPAPRCWVEDHDFGAGAVPVAQLERIREWLR